ncbi:hypothetical protein HY441_00645 [Candidatus Microgenomates bacterium]|nr:hypothetical protein [Candidatus Microgenomates bacterium]
MKLKDLIALGLLGVVLIIIGSLLVGKLGRGGQQRAAEVEVVQPIDPNFSEEGRSILLGKDDKRKIESFSAPLNLEQGFGNTDPFRAE